MCQHWGFLWCCRFSSHIRSTTPQSSGACKICFESVGRKGVYTHRLLSPTQSTRDAVWGLIPTLHCRYLGGLRLLQATCKKFYQFCSKQGWNFLSSPSDTTAECFNPFQTQTNQLSLSLSPSLQHRFDQTELYAEVRHQHSSAGGEDQFDNCYCETFRFTNFVFK